MDKIFQTMGGDPRNFNKLDLYKLPSPCFVIDKRALIDNLLTLNNLKSQTGVKILVALKAFSTPYFGSLISENLDGFLKERLVLFLQHIKKTILEKLLNYQIISFLIPQTN